MSIDMDGKRQVKRMEHVFLRGCAVLMMGFFVAVWGNQAGDTGIALAQSTAPAPVCTAPGAVTPALTEGPYYTPNSPERTSLIEPGIQGTPIIVMGYVLTKDCRPVAHAWLDFWQADGAGTYDNTGFKLRGHQYADEAGRYYLETVLPGEYPGRTPHIHVKIQAPNGPILTTQMFFPDMPGNRRDSIFSPELVVSILNPETNALATGTAPAPVLTAEATEEARPVIYTINFILGSQ